MKRSRPILVTLALSTSAAVAQTAPPTQAARGGESHERVGATTRVMNNAAAENAGSTIQRSGGSLWKATLASTPEPNQAKLTQVSFFAVPQPEPHTIKKHDLVTIIIREESAFSSQGTTDLKKNADFQAAIDQYVKISLANLSISPGGGAGGGAAPTLQLTGSRDFKGDATVDRTDSFTARVEAEVIDIKPNGTLVLQATKHIKTDEEEQTFVLTGMCRAEDVTPDNSILSTQLHDQDLQKTHKGAVRDTTKRGLIPRLLDFINPF